MITRLSLLVLVLFVSIGSAATTALSMQVANRSHETRDGLTVFIGVMPAEVIKEHPAGHPEITMHGGVPADSNEYHLVAAIFDAVSGVRITDATVTATVFGPGNTMIHAQRHLTPWASRSLSESVPRQPLEPMPIAQTVTYGGYFVLPKPARYVFQLAITRPERDKPTIMNFTYDHRV